MIEPKFLKRTEELTFAITKQQEANSMSLSKGPWAGKETEVLKEMYEDHAYPRPISHRLGRTETSVKASAASITKYFEELDKTSSRFHSRFMIIWQRLMMFSKSRKWCEALSSLPPGSWLSLIAEHTPENFKSMLASDQPPSIAQLKSLEWSDTPAAGVFGWILKQNKPVSSENQHYLYVGSTTEHNGGLRYHRLKLLSPSAWTQNDPKVDIRDLDLDTRGQFVTLFEIPFKDDSYEEISRVRHLVTLAKTVFVVWLGAVKDHSKPAITELVPWGLENIRYHGLSGYRAVMQDIHDSVTTREKTEEVVKPSKIRHKKWLSKNSFKRWQQEQIRCEAAMQELDTGRNDLKDEIPSDHGPITAVTGEATTHEEDQKPALTLNSSITSCPRTATVEADPR